MRIESLKVFCDVVEWHSFTEAAQANGISESAVSQELAYLESLCETALINPRNRNWKLNSEGQVCYDHARQIVALYTELQQRIQQVREWTLRDAQAFHVSVLSDLGLYHLPPQLQSFSRRCPSVSVAVVYRSNEEVYEDVKSGTAAVGLVSYPRRRSRWTIIPLPSERLILICPPRHLFAQIGRIGLGDLAGQKFINLELDGSLEQNTRRMLKNRGVLVRTCDNYTNVEIIKRLVERGIGVALVPEASVSQEIARGSLVAVEIQQESFTRPLAAILPKQQAGSPVLEEFLAVLKKRPCLPKPRRSTCIEII